MKGKRRATKKYPGCIKRRGDSWQIRLCVAGKYHGFSVRGTRLDAENFATEKHLELSGDHGRARDGRPAPIRFSALVDQFETFRLPLHPAGTVKSYGVSFRAFRRYFVDVLHDPLVRDIRRSDVATFLEWRRTPRPGKTDADKLAVVSAHTVARDRRVLSVLFSYAIEKDHIEHSPTDHTKPPKSDPRNPPILTDGQLEAFLKACAPSPMLHLYVLLLAETGARAFTEALQLKWEDFDFAGGFVRLVSAPSRRMKTGRSRTLPMTERLRAALREHAARFRMVTYGGERSPFIFHHEMTRRSAVAGQRITSLRDSFMSAAKKAEMPKGFRQHDLRHRRVTTFLGGGHSPALVMVFMGHTSIATTLGYMHLVPEHLRSLVAETPAPAQEKVSG